MPSTRNQKSVAPAEREEDDSVPISSPPRKRSSGLLSDQSKKRPKPKPKVTPTRAQPDRTSSSHGESITNHASSSRLLEKLDNNSEEIESHNLTPKRPKARPLRAKEKNGDATHSSQSRRECVRHVNYKESENSSEDQDEEDRARDLKCEVGVEKMKKKGSRKKIGAKADGEEQIVRLTLPKLSYLDKEMEDQLQKYRDIISQTDSIKNDKLEHFQEESFELPQSSRGLKNCPICHELLPLKPSKGLHRLLDFWLGKIRNGDDMSSSTAAVECCELHEFEKEHLPRAKQNKWPMILSEEEIELEVWNDDEIYDRLMDLVINPEKSHFYIRQKERREKDGRQASSIQSQMKYFHEQQAGYFGELGAVVIRRTIFLLFEEQWNPRYTLEDFTNRPNNWMTDSDFVDQVLLPEVVCALIQKREKKKMRKEISIREAERIRDESNIYGSIMFPVDKEGEKDTDDLFFESTSPVSTKRFSSGSQGRHCSQTRRKLTYKNPVKCEEFHEEAIEVSSAQPTSSSRSKRQTARKHEPSSQQLQTPSASPNRPRPRPSQSSLFPQRARLDFFGEPQYSSQDRIKNWDVPQLASSPDLQASSISSTAHKNSVLGSSQIASDGTSPLTELETIQNDSTYF